MMDYHIHSTYSIDGKSPLHAYSAPAQKRTLKEIGFAEHVDVNPDIEGFEYLDFPAYYTAVTSLNKHTVIPVKCGIEISYEPHIENKVRDYVSFLPCDYVIGSVHEVEKKTMDHTFLEQSDPVLYFEAVNSLIHSKTCDIIGHLEYFKRWGGPYTSHNYKDIIVTTLKKIIDSNLVLEVNTSGLRHPAKDTYPSLEVIKWYKALGGILISLGSDAHNAHHIGYKFPEIITALHSIGFTHLATFEARKCTTLPIV
ncbi:MAG: histidinol-phosphatase HisJ family protein [Candidatus Methanofastidiosia archaeon]|jgi:histidinol-phosphatase (PHP family)